jgi:hypothetical protein
LVDNFNGAALDASKWKPYADPGYSVAQTNQQLRMVNSTNASGWAGVGSVNRYDGTASELRIQLVDAANAASPAIAWIWLKLIQSGANGNAVEISLGAGQLRAKKWTAGVETEWRKPFDAMTMRWLRLRQAGPSLFWEHSPDALAWTNLHTEPTPMDMTALYVEIGAGGWPGPLGTAVVDNVNSPP